MKRIVTYIILGTTILIFAGVLYLITNGSPPLANQANNNAKHIVSKKEESKFVSYSPGESFITNVKNSNRYLKVKVIMEIRNEKSKEYFEKNNYKIRDIIIGVLRSKTEADLILENSQDNLKESIMAMLDSHLNMDNLIKLYIEEFVIQ